MFIVHEFLDCEKMNYSYAIYEDNGRVFLDKYELGILFVETSADDNFLAKFALFSLDNKYKLCNIVEDDVVVGEIFILALHRINTFNCEWYMQIYGVNFDDKGFLPSSRNLNIFEYNLFCSLVAQRIIQDRKLAVDIFSNIYVRYNNVGYKLSQIVRW